MNERKKALVVVGLAVVLLALAFVLLGLGAADVAAREEPAAVSTVDGFAVIGTGELTGTVEVAPSTDHRG